MRRAMVLVVIAAIQGIPLASAAATPSYAYQLPVEPVRLVRGSPRVFAAFVAPLRRDIDATLISRQKMDRAYRRSLLGTRVELRLIGCDDAGALHDIAAIRELEAPRARMTSGLRFQAIAQAGIDAGRCEGRAFIAAFGRRYAAALRALPQAVSAASLKAGMRAYRDVTSASIVHQIQTDIDPNVSPIRTIEFERARELVNLYFMDRVVLPFKGTAVAAIEARLTGE